MSCRRIEKYLLQEDVDSTIEYTGNGDITLEEATFTWPQEQDEASPRDTLAVGTSAPTAQSTFTLAGLSVTFPNGKLSLICGRLGSGKSLLLAGLLGEADLLTGRMDCPRSAPNVMGTAAQSITEEDWIIKSMLAYVPQQAWLQNASLKDNIIFSAPWDEERYQAVLEACSLTSDLLILEDGDET